MFERKKGPRPEIYVGDLSRGMTLISKSVIILGHFASYVNRQWREDMVFNTHSMNVAVAVKYGATKALVLEQINSWIKYNEANNLNFHDGKYWTYNSVEAWTELIPYFSYEQMRKILKDLESDGLIIKGKFNKSPLDKTLWYSITDKGYAELSASYTICEKTQIDLGKNTNASVEKPDSICEKTQSNTINKTIINKPSIEKKDINSSNDSFISKEKPAKAKEPQGIRPSKEEVEAFIKERGYHITYQDMDDYYTNYGKYPFWMMMSQKKEGKEPPFVKSWKGCCKTFEDNWKRRNGDKPAYKEEKNPYSYDPDDPENKRIRERQLKEMRELGYVV